MEEMIHRMKIRITKMKLSKWDFYISKQAILPPSLYPLHDPNQQTPSSILLRCQPHLFQCGDHCIDGGTSLLELLCGKVRNRSRIQIGTDYDHNLPPPGTQEPSSHLILSFTLS